MRGINVGMGVIDYLVVIKQALGPGGAGLYSHITCLYLSRFLGRVRLILYTVFLIPFPRSAPP